MLKIGLYINEFLINGYDPKHFIEKILYSLTNSNTGESASDIELFCLGKQAKFIPEPVKVWDKVSKLDCILVFGGDGTILSAVNFALNSHAPILGINLGKLGFLTDFSLSETGKYLPQLLTGKYRVLHRMLLEVSVTRKGKVIYKDFALNDSVIYKGLVSRLINIRLSCSGKFVLETRCDGMIAATPTGSTAYSLAAGGPILSPVMDAFVVSALCPHVLSVRPMVFPADDYLTFKMAKVYKETMLQIDGKNVQSLIDNDRINVKAAKNKISFITLTGKNFYQTLRKKLHMGKL